jgi:hypothetical protein
MERLPCNKLGAFGQSTFDAGDHAKGKVGFRREVRDLS